MIPKLLNSLQYGRLTIVGEPFKKENSRYRKVIATCICGVTKEYYLHSLVYSQQLSCGCLRNEAGEKRKTHGLSNHPLYRAWTEMNRRCYNEKRDNYARYGGRGITVCEEWRNDFKTFYDWAINSGWAEGLWIDRRENDGNYEPSNCRWVTVGESNINRTCVKLTKEKADTIREMYASKNYSQKELANMYGVTKMVISLTVRNKLWQNA